MPESTDLPNLTNPPARLKDRYRLTQWLGQGSMGLVYRAHDETLKRDVAIKFLAPRQMTGSEASQRFLREAQTVARLSHPNIMSLYDVDRDGGWHYLVLEYIAGVDLQAKLTEAGGPLPLTETVTIARKLLEALAYAHAQGLLHRDIKPENIMLTQQGEVKVTDFGLAYPRGDVRLTSDEMIVGTVLYLAPEVVAGQPPDQRADLYAVGAVLYELLTAQPIFTSDNPVSVFSQILHAPIPPPRTLNAEIPPKIEALITRLLAKNPAERYPSAEDALLALPDITTSPRHAPLPTLAPTANVASSSRLARLAQSAIMARPQQPDTTAPQAQDLLLAAGYEDVAEALEAERRRLAHLLQHNIIEALELLLAQTNTYEQSLERNPNVRMAMSVLGSLVRQVSQSARDLSDNLHPATLESLGLEPALEALANQMRRSYGLQVALNVPRMAERLPHKIELALFRLAQSALERSVQQARASQTSVDLTVQADQVQLRLSDNGSNHALNEAVQSAWQRIEQLGGSVEFGQPRQGPQQGPQQGGLLLKATFTITPPVELTLREMEVIQLLTEGLSNKEIALALSVSPRTVNFHLDNIYAKLGVNSRTEAAIYALRQGWTRQSPP